MKRLAQAILASLVTFTRVSVPWRLEPESFEDATWHIPLIGWLNAGILALVWLYLPLPVDLKLFLLLLLPILLSGAMHEDGLADSADGLFGGVDREARLLIMKDPRVGSFGVMALVLLGLGNYLALKNLPHFAVVHALAIVLPLSRLSGPVLAAVLPYARGETGKEKNKAGRFLSPHRKKLLWSLLWVLPVIYFVPTLEFGVTLLGSLALCLGCSGWIFHKKLGGMTGDCLGAAIKVTEFVLLWVIVWNFTP